MKSVLLIILCLAAQPLWAATLEAKLAEIQHRWAEIQYQLPEGKKESAFEELAKEAEQFVADYPDRAEPLIWQGIVLSTYAGAKGGLGALGLVKDARKSLEAALAIDAEALNGSAYTSLGSLYYQVPGWPLSFGDDDKARQYLQKALAIGDFLLDQGEPERARSYLQKVLEAPGRTGRDIADTGRREEARERLVAK
jgi:tetratricopeptide (TPR) repeat protein